MFPAPDYRTQPSHGGQSVRVRMKVPTDASRSVRNVSRPCPVERQTFAPLFYARTATGNLPYVAFQSPAKNARFARKKPLNYQAKKRPNLTPTMSYVIIKQAFICNCCGSKTIKLIINVAFAKNSFLEVYGVGYLQQCQLRKTNRKRIIK